MRYKESVSHNKDVFKLAKLSLKRAIFGLEDFLIEPTVPTKDIFLVVGCGHSGTTLTAAKLGNHRKALAIGRETEFLLKAKNSKVTSSKILNEWCYFAEILKKDFIVEKTPKHLYSVKRMISYAPNAKIIAMIRNPLDNIASLYKRFGDLEYSIQRWCIDNSEILKIQNRSNVKLVKYEDLTSRPKDSFDDICNFLRIEFEEEMILECDSVYGSLPQEKNMKIRQEQVKSEIKPNSGKWKEIFSGAEPDLIRQRTQAIAKKLGYE